MSLASLADPLSELVTRVTSLIGYRVESVHEPFWCHTDLTPLRHGEVVQCSLLIRWQQALHTETLPDMLWREAEMHERASGSRGVMSIFASVSGIL